MHANTNHSWKLNTILGLLSYFYFCNIEVQEQEPGLGLVHEKIFF